MAMKKRIGILLMMISLGIYSTASGAEPASDAISRLEIPGMQWGAPASDYPDLTEVGKEGDVRRYEKNSESLVIGGVTPTQVVYGFYRDQFFAAYFKILSESDFEVVKTNMTDLYGPPRAQLRVSQTIYIWAKKNVKLKLKHYEKEVRFKVGLYYTPISTEVNESRMEKGFEKSIKLAPTN
jgi:hypothetical protein